MDRQPPGARILVVEDSRTQAQELALVLADAGFETRLAHDAAQALQQLDQERIDLVLSDVLMPGMTGYDLCRRIRQRPAGKHLPVILLTSLNDPEDIIQGLSSGADNFIIKPFEPATLVQRIQRILASRTTHQERGPATELLHGDKNVVISSEKGQILELLLTTVEEFVRSKQREFESRVAEETLRKSKDLLQAALDALSSGVAVLDDQGRVVAANRVWDQLSGKGNASIPSRSASLFETALPWGLPDAEVGPRIQTALEEVSVGRREEYQCEFLAGGEGPTSYLLSIRRCHTSPHARLVVAVEDITQRKMAEQERTERLLQEAARTKAEAVSRAKDEFMAMLAHELRNPLAPIVSALEIVRATSGEQPAVRDAVAIMDRQIHQLTHLVDDLLDVARATTGKIQLQKARVAIPDVIAAAAEATQPLIERRQHKLTIDLPPQRLEVDGDFHRLAQVVANLLNNAAKYTEPGGTITVTAYRSHGHVQLTVRDTGVGIPPERLPQIFELFTQVETSLDRSQGGLGIGLSLVRRLVELHGGQVAAHSDGRGQGSEFQITLPLASDMPAVDNSQTTATKHVAAPSTLRVLVVDDNRDAADTMAMLLKIERHEVTTAYDGLEAIRLADEFHPHVVLLDIGLPKANGYEVARRLRMSPDHKNVYLIALTGYGQQDDRKRTLAAGFDHHLLKPVEIAQLREALAAVPKDR